MLENFLFFAGSGGAIGPYEQVIGAAIIILFSHSFEFFSKKYGIPSVILLIGLGMAIAWAFTEFMNIEVGDSIIPVLNILGIVGLILIVLEAALDLKLKKEKTVLITKAFAVALFVLFATVFGIAFVLIYFLKIDLLPALVYATPLSVMSSSIVLPSVGNLSVDKKEFMIYEATFSDILGIILFFFLTSLDLTQTSMSGALFSELWKIIVTIIISVVVCYGMVWFISGLTKKANFFTIFALLALFYALGKKYHLSSLITILVFGLILNNEKIFFRKWLKKLYSPEHHPRIIEDFKLLTHQSAFLVRTFFFVAFGMIISVGALTDLNVLMVSGIILLIIYAVRFAHLQLVSEHSIFPELFIAPRGLITVLLFFQIPENYQLEQFNDGIMFVVIIVTAVVMMIALIFTKKEYNVFEDITTVDNSSILGYGRDADIPQEAMNEN